MRFDSENYVKAFVDRGEYPAIHNVLCQLINATVFNPMTDVFDLGCCTGLLSVRLAKRFAFVTGFDISENNIAVAKALKAAAFNTAFVKQKITVESLKPFLDEAKPKLVVARRVFPEISNGDVEVIKRMSELFYLSGVKHIAIEGRVDSSRSTHPLRNVEEEIKCFESFYKVIARKKNCVILQSITDEIQ